MFEQSKIMNQLIISKISSNKPLINNNTSIYDKNIITYIYKIITMADVI